MALRDIRDLLKARDQVIERARLHVEQVTGSKPPRPDFLRKEKQRELAAAKDRLKASEETRAATLARLDQKITAQKADVARIEKELADLDAGGKTPPTKDRPTKDPQPKAPTPKDPPSGGGKPKPVKVDPDQPLKPKTTRGRAGKR